MAPLPAQGGKGLFMGENEPPSPWRATAWQAVPGNEGMGMSPFTLSETHKIIECPPIIFPIEDVVKAVHYVIREFYENR